MANINDNENLTVCVELPVPKPVYIVSGMGIPYWKSHFVLKRDEEDSSSAKTLYTRCLKVLLWAEFCNATISYVGNSKDEEGNLKLKFIFRFPDVDCQFLFQMDWLSNLNVVAKL